MKDKLVESDDFLIFLLFVGLFLEISLEDEQENFFVISFMSNLNSFLIGKYKGFVKRRGVGRGKKFFFER